MSTFIEGGVRGYVDINVSFSGNKNITVYLVTVTFSNITVY